MCANRVRRTALRARYRRCLSLAARCCPFQCTIARRPFGAAAAAVAVAKLNVSSQMHSPAAAATAPQQQQRAEQAGASVACCLCVRVCVCIAMARLHAACLALSRSLSLPDACLCKPVSQPAVYLFGWPSPSVCSLARPRAARASRVLALKRALLPPAPLPPIAASLSLSACLSRSRKSAAAGESTTKSLPNGLPRPSSRKPLAANDDERRAEAPSRPRKVDRETLRQRRRRLCETSAAGRAAAPPARDADERLLGRRTAASRSATTRLKVGAECRYVRQLAPSGLPPTNIAQSASNLPSSSPTECRPQISPARAAAAAGGDLSRQSAE